MQNFSADHEHVFLGEGHARNERRVWLVIVLTATMMVLEIAGGSIFGSMALVADGWHMSTHAAAMLISALAYLYARRHARDPRFTFGTGKLGDLAGFSSAIVLALVALMIGWESLLRLTAPVPIHYGQAMAVAALGLAVNLLSAWLLRGEEHHHHDHGDLHHHHDTDNNLRAAYLHVLADALTSVLAIAALLLGWLNGWAWADPLMGVIGALVIARWSWGLIRDTGGVLLDQASEGGHLAGEVREALAAEPVTLTDLHVWQIGPGHHAAIVALQAARPKTPAEYRGLLAGIHELSHVTVEVSVIAKGLGGADAVARGISPRE